MQAQERKYDIRMQAAGATNSELEISCIGSIGIDAWHGKDWFLSQFRNDLNYAFANGNYNGIRLIIHSEGGCVFTTFAMIGLLKLKNVHITAHVIGMAASAASILMLAADTIELEELSSIMIHNPSCGVRGESKDLIKIADELEAIKSEMVNFYVKRTKLSEQEIKDYMDAETWFYPTEAIEKGFADKVISTEKRVQNSFQNSEGHRKVLNDLNTKKITNILNYYDMSIDATNKDAPPQNNGGDFVGIYAAFGKDEKEFVAYHKGLVVENQQQKTRIEALEQELVVEKKNRHSDYVDNAVTQGRITPAEKSTYMKMSFELAAELISKKKPQKSVETLIHATGHNNAGRAGWDWDKWQKEDPRGLEKLEKEDNVSFLNLYNSKFK